MGNDGSKGEKETFAEAGADGLALQVADLLKGIPVDKFSATQQAQVKTLEDLLRDPGFYAGNPKKGVANDFKFNEETGLYYVCSGCEIDGDRMPEAMFKDFAGGGAQQRYNDVCRHEKELSSDTTKQEKKDNVLRGPERLIQGIYALPTPLADRDFVWREWSACFDVGDKEQLYISVASCPEKDEDLCPAEQDMVRGKLHLAATVVRQKLGEPSAKAASIMHGDLRGKMPRTVQNIVAGGSSSYLANFRDAHSGSLDMYGNPEEKDDDDNNFMSAY